MATNYCCSPVVSSFSQYCYYGYCALQCCNINGQCASSASQCSDFYNYINTAAIVTAVYIVGIVIGTIVGVQFLSAVIFFLCWFFKRRTRLAKVYGAVVNMGTPLVKIGTPIMDTSYSGSATPTPYVGMQVGI